VWKIGSLSGISSMGPVRENPRHAVREGLHSFQWLPGRVIGIPLRPVKIVDHEEAAAEQIFAQLVGLILREQPMANLDRVHYRPVIDVVGTVEIDHLLTERVSMRVSRRTTWSRCRSDRG
jgi:hypothetical protein